MTTARAVGAGAVEAMTRSAQAGDAPSPFKSRQGRASPTPYQVALDVPLAARSSAQAASTEPRLGVPQQIGFARDLMDTATSAGTAQHLQWQATRLGGVSAAISFSTGGASGVRLGMVVRRIPADAVVRVYAQKSVTAFEVSGRDILAMLQSNVKAEGESVAAHTYWTPAVEGEEVTMEMELALGTSPTSVDISVPRLSHLYVSPGSDTTASAKALTSAGTTKRVGDAAFCEVDVSCDSTYKRESSATAKMNFVAADGVSYLCTGTLLNDRNSTGTPYFLSANHCIGLQSEASTLTTYWFYRSQSCNSSSVDSSTTTLTGGATLLYASASTDTSFMQLISQPPTGALYAAWDPSIPVLNTSVAGVHHPQGDLQKISYGSLTAYAACTAINPVTEQFTCPTSTQANAKFVSTRWTRGVTEAGSSGSGLYKTVGASKYLIGQLYGGSSSCTNPTANDSYGRFDLAYTAALSKWLEGRTCP